MEKQKRVDLEKLYPVFAVVSDQESEKLMEAINGSLQLGTCYDRRIALTIIYFIIAREGKEYKKLIGYIKRRLSRSSVRFRLKPFDVLALLIQSMSAEDGRTYRYLDITFDRFARKAVSSIIASQERQRSNSRIFLKSGVPCYDDEPGDPCNITEYAPDPDRRTVEDKFIENENISRCISLVKQDPVAYQILQLRLEGKCESEIAGELKLDINEVYNGVKRLKRIAKKTYPEEAKVCKQRKKNWQRTNRQKKDK